MLVVIIILSIIGVLLLLHHLFPLVQVCGNSMYPTYQNGEILIGRRIFLKRNIKEGDVIVYKCPADGKTVIKRVFGFTGDNKFYCLGDNSEHSFDSRHYGGVSSKNLICRVKTREKED